MTATDNLQVDSGGGLRQQLRSEFLQISDNLPALLIVRKFLSENILLLENANGNVIDVESMELESVC